MSFQKRLAGDVDIIGKMVAYLLFTFCDVLTVHKCSNANVVAMIIRDLFLNDEIQLSVTVGHDATPSITLGLLKDHC